MGAVIPCDHLNKTDILPLPLTLQILTDFLERFQVHRKMKFKSRESPPTPSPYTRPLAAQVPLLRPTSLHGHVTDHPGSAWRVSWVLTHVLAAAVSHGVGATPTHLSLPHDPWEQFSSFY